MQFKGMIKVTDGKGNTLVNTQNTITHLLEEVVAAGGIDSLYSAYNPVEMGASFLSNKTPIAGGSGERDSNAFPYEPLTVYFLNLTEGEKNALSSDSTVLPVYTSDFQIDDKKIVGYAYAIAEATEGKQGYSDEVTGLTLINPRRHGQKFKWDADVMQGSYNCIAVGLNVMYSRMPGIAVYRGLECNNVIKGQAAQEGYMVRPGVKSSDGSVVITTDEEILVGDSTATQKGRRKINLKTGEVTLLTTTDPAYDFPLYRAKYSQQVVGDFLIVTNSTSSGTRISIKDKSTSTLNGIGGFLYNGYYYTRQGYQYTSTYKYDISTWKSSTSDIDFNNVNTPDILLSKNSTVYFVVTNLDETHYLASTYYASKTSAPNANYGQMIGGVIFTDPTDIASSITRILPNLESGNGCKVGDKYYFFSDSILMSDAYGRNFKYKMGTTNKTIEKLGAKFTTEDLVGNMLSFHVFDSPQEIPVGEAVKLEYYYTFEQ